MLKHQNVYYQKLVLNNIHLDHFMIISLIEILCGEKDQEIGPFSSLVYSMDAQVSAQISCPLVNEISVLLICWQFLVRGSR